MQQEQSPPLPVVLVPRRTLPCSSKTSLLSLWWRWMLSLVNANPADGADAGAGYEPELVEPEPELVMTG